MFLLVAVESPKVRRILEGSLLATYAGSSGLLNHTSHLDDVQKPRATNTAIIAMRLIAFLLIFKRTDLAELCGADLWLILGSGFVTALPMFLYSNCVMRFSLIFMCFAQYLSPTFNLICGFLTGERFSRSQLTSLLYFLAAIVIFTLSEARQIKKEKS